jgi:hypothetical protein
MSESKSAGKIFEINKIARALSKPKAYMEKYLSKSPSNDIYRHKKQNDLDVYQRHLLNDKMAQAVKQNFCILGKKLNTIKDNFIEQTKYAQAHERLQELQNQYN